MSLKAEQSKRKLSKIKESAYESFELVNATQKTAFSFELLPPLKGNSIQQVFNAIDRLKEFDPKYINITTHHSENVYQEDEKGVYRKVNVRRRPGTVAIAATIQYRYGIRAIPHIISRGFSKEETEYALIDLSFLGLTDLLLLRGDAKNLDAEQRAMDSHLHATGLQEQVNNFNKGIGYDGAPFTAPEESFSYGMACYPEKHEESPNMESEIYYTKMKVDNGADYLVTQMFFDNSKYFEFVERCREAGITVPIIPGIKPIHLMNQLTVLPRYLEPISRRSWHPNFVSARTMKRLKRLGWSGALNSAGNWYRAECQASTSMR